jgi:diacylglycerol kinase family enzyme
MPTEEFFFSRVIVISTDALLPFLDALRPAYQTLAQIRRAITSSTPANNDGYTRETCPNAMDNARDLPTQSSGTVNRQPATFHYDPESKNLTCELQNGDLLYFKAEYIIGVKDNGGWPAGYTIVAVEDQNRDSQEQNKVPAVIHTYVEDLPEAFVHEYRVLPQVERQLQGLAQIECIPTIHVIVSTLSGIGNAACYFRDLVKPFLTILELQEHKHYVVHYTESAQTITKLTNDLFLSQANQGLECRIFLLSGDGGILDILNALHSKPHTARYREPVVALLPVGTGNALAHSSGLTKDKTLGLAALARGTPKHLPLFKARFTPGARLLVDEGSNEETIALQENGSPVLYGAVVCSWGLHAGLVGDSDTAEYRKYGVERFKMAAKEALFPKDGSEPHRYKAKVSLMKRDATGAGQWTQVDRPDHAYVLATMVSNLEEQFMISPASKPLDGHLRVVHFGHTDGNEVMRIMTLAYQAGKHVEDDLVSYEDVEGVKIAFEGQEKDPRWRRICVDGKIVRVEEDGWVEVRKDTANALKLLTLT